MASLKDVRIKISGVTKTKQITRAMNMVASAKLRGAQARMEKFRAYADAFHNILHNLAAREGEMTHALLVKREEVAKVGIVLVTSDRGLCGGFNVNLVNAALKTAMAQKAEGKEVVFYCVGKKGRDAIRKSAFPLERDYTGVLGSLNYIVADRIGLDVIDAFLRHDVDEVFLVYSEFLSLMRTNPTARRILPVQPEEAAKAAPGGADYLLEPSGAALLNTLLPRIVKALVYRGLLDTSTCENAARMAAMDNATRNCDDLIKSLTRLFNKTRQAVITNELIDIVGGVEALKG